MRTIDEILNGSGYSKSEIELFLIECSIDYLTFAKRVLGFDIADYHKEWYDLLEKFPRLCIEAYRGSGKTSYIAGFLLWKAIFNERQTILIISTTFEQSKIVLKLIREMVSGNELLRGYMPSSRESTWKATELTLKNGSIFYSRTYGESVKGLRIDWLFCDEAGQYADKTIFWTSISPVVQLNRGRIIVVGTPESHFDLLHELKDNDTYYFSEYPAEKDGKPLWPQKYTTAERDEFGRRSLVQIRKEIGELPYMQEYLLIPISSANSLFPYELTLKCVDANSSFMPFGKVGEKYYVGFDLSISETGDWNVITVIKKNAEGKQIVAADRFHGDFQEQRRRLTKIQENFKPVKVLMDKTGIGEQAFREFSQIFSNVEPFHFTAEEKYKLVMDLRHEFENFLISIPGGKDDITTYAYTQELLKELNEFTIHINEKTKKLKFGGGRYDDCVISLALAVKAAHSEYGETSITLI